MRKPTLGEIVHFVSYGTVRCTAALVSEVDPAQPEAVSLTVFAPNANSYPVQRSIWRADRELSGTWHWPHED
jgi:hypothetical protein